MFGAVSLFYCILLKNLLNVVKKEKRLTDEDMIIRRVGQDDGVTEQTSGVVCGGSGHSHAGEWNALTHRPRRGGCSMGQSRDTEWLSFGFRKVLDGWGCDEE